MPTRPEAVVLELFTNRFAGIAAEMGEMLKRTAVSTNVKERLAWRCSPWQPMPSSGARRAIWPIS